MLRTRKVKPVVKGHIWHPGHPLNGKPATFVSEDSRGLVVIIDSPPNHSIPGVRKNANPSPTLIRNSPPPHRVP